MEINPHDASALEITDGGMMRVMSRRGEVMARAKVTETLPSGVVFITFHFAESSANALTNSALDPSSKIPEYKIYALRVEKVVSATNTSVNNPAKKTWG